MTCGLSILGNIGYFQRSTLANSTVIPQTKKTEQSTILASSLLMGLGFSPFKKRPVNCGSNDIIYKMIVPVVPVDIAHLQIGPRH